MYDPRMALLQAMGYAPPQAVAHSQGYGQPPVPMPGQGQLAHPMHGAQPMPRTLPGSQRGQLPPMWPAGVPVRHAQTLPMQVGTPAPRL